MRSSTALSPVGLWTAPEATYVFGSLKLAGIVARVLDRRPALVAGNPLGRTLAFGQIAARPWRMEEATASEMLNGLARAPGFERTRRALFDYRVRGFVSDVPVTIGWGRRDLMTPPYQIHRAARFLPQARRVALTGCGHSPMVDDPEQVARVLLDASRS